MFIDLTKWISAATAPFPGDTPPQLTQETTVSEDGFATRTLTLPSHLGTHCDAPAHVLENGKKLDDYPLERFIGPAHLAVLPRLTARTPISVEMLEPFEALFTSHARVLLRTDWEQTAADTGADFFRDSPFLTTEAAQWIARHQIGLLGSDMPTVDEFIAALPAHHVLLGADVLLLENLTNLEQLDQLAPLQEFRLMVLPLKVQDAEGAPVRAVAEWQNAEWQNSEW